jgi:hypothetical protein
MAHKVARTVTAAAELYDNFMFFDEDPVARVVNAHPEYVHKFADGVLEADSPLLNSTRGADLVRILDNRIILLDPAKLGSYTDTNICDMPGNIPALLRRAWYDTYSFVPPNTTLPDYSEWNEDSES